VRRASVIQTLATTDRRRRLAVTADERVASALALGRRDLEIYGAASGLTAREARVSVERRRQARRRASISLDALLR
jgi:hypothetical protein